MTNCLLRTCQHVRVPVKCRTDLCDFSGCQCDIGYARLYGKDSLCIPTDDCPPFTITPIPTTTKTTTTIITCKEPHQVPYSCWTSCRARTCINVQQTNKTCPILFCPVGLPKTCDCKEGYASITIAKNKTKCIPVRDCPPITTTKTTVTIKCKEPHQVPYLCWAPCTERTCDNVQEKHKICPDILCRIGIYTCDCKEGYASIITVKNKKKCIPVCDCPPLTTTKVVVTI